MSTATTPRQCTWIIASGENKRDRCYHTVKTTDPFCRHCMKYKGKVTEKYWELMLNEMMRCTGPNGARCNPGHIIIGDRWMLRPDVLQEIVLMEKLKARREQALYGIGSNINRCPVVDDQKHVADFWNSQKDQIRGLSDQQLAHLEFLSEWARTNVTKPMFYLNDGTVVMKL